MNNRSFFVKFVNQMFSSYKEQYDSEENNITCADLNKSVGNFTLLMHQRIILDYLNIYTPYRGLLLFHSLGAGKSCSSIAIAEGLSTTKKIIIMLPASLEPNYVAEIKKCGDYIFKKNQHWTWVTLGPDTKTQLRELSVKLHYPTKMIKKTKGMFFVEPDKPPNFDSLTDEKKKLLESQINIMIKTKYMFINYNGITNKKFDELTENGQNNIFDNSVIIIDEAHNLVSRIVNKIENKNNSHFLSIKLYNMMLSAENSKFVMLSGTPIINYPNELGILFNILRGYIKTWTMTLKILTNKRVDINLIRNILAPIKVLDYVEYSPSSKMLTITKDPLGFENKIGVDKITGEYNYRGVSNDKKERIDKKTGIKTYDNILPITDEEFINRITIALKKQDIEVIKNSIKTENFTALPYKSETFLTMFPSKINNVTNEPYILNGMLFKKRIIGLCSYFRSSQEGLLPDYDEETDLKEVLIEMSDHQFGIYELARKNERLLERQALKNNNNANPLTDTKSSTYKIFSRLYCNFVMPEGLTRPLPNNKNVKTENNEDKKDDLNDEEGHNNINDTNGVNKEGVIEIEVEENLEKLENIDDGDNLLDTNKDDDEIFLKDDALYLKQVKKTMNTLEKYSSRFLTLEKLNIYSPKFAQIIRNLTSPENIGSNMLYSQFRTMEGVGIFILALNQNGFAQFKIKKNAGGWEVDIKEEDYNKPKYILYTGKEDKEEKAILKNIYNSEWNNNQVPQNILEYIKQKDNNNYYGQIIKLIIITASGAEGINLTNTRYVHIMEPYWHPVRTDQVIGRARRICSHQYLPRDLQNVTVYIYLMKFSEKQLKSRDAITLITRDTSKLIKGAVYTTDQTLYEISMIKKTYSKLMTKLIKEASIDCSTYSRTNAGEKIDCLSFNDNDKNKFIFTPDFNKDSTDENTQFNIQSIVVNYTKVTVNGVDYALKDGTTELYDLTSYLRGKPVFIKNMDDNLHIKQMATYEKTKIEKKEKTEKYNKQHEEFLERENKRKMFESKQAKHTI